MGWRVGGLFTVGASRHHTKVLKKIKRRFCFIVARKLFMVFFYGGVHIPVISWTVIVLVSSKEVLLNLDAEQTACPDAITPLQDILM
jgi:hypothetical protein